jgi:predicted GNAT family N-acyltransferase
MHARKHAIGFYEKMGYKVKGDEFEEVTIPHFLMEKHL